MPNLIFINYKMNTVCPSSSAVKHQIKREKAQTIYFSQERMHYSNLNLYFTSFAKKPASLNSVQENDLSFDRLVVQWYTL